MSAKNFLNNLKIAIIGYSGAFLLLALRRTLRLKIIVNPAIELDWSNDCPTILVFWHNQQLMMPWLYLDSKSTSSKKPIYALISKSTDGRLIAKAMKAIGIESVAGSSSRGGKEALVQLVKIVKAGSHIAITPDGPKGPLYKVKVGALKVSQLTGARILPSCFAAQNYWRFNSWDKMILPKPFSKAVMIVGEPLFVAREANESEVSEHAVRLENELNRISSEAQKLISSL